MDQRNHQQPPLLDLNSLDEDHEIIMEYDSNGNLTRVRKVRRYEGCLAWVVILLIAVVVGIGWYFYVPGP